MQELFRVPQKDATVQLEDAAAIVNQWHAAYMEVMILPTGVLVSLPSWI